MKNKELKCLVTDCTRTVRSRGLCDTHYTALSAKVARGKYTWEQLVAAGACLKSHNRNPNSGLSLREFLKSKGLE